jgi:hypothetical protein
MTTSSQRCWDPKTSKNYKKSYFINTESGVSQWGRQDRKHPLPAGWEYCTSKKGDGFYYNHHFNRAQWEKPTESQKLPVPEGFEEKRSTKCQNVYYFDSKTGKTQWEYPIEKESRGSEDLLDYESDILTKQSFDDYYPDPYSNQDLDLRTKDVMAKSYSEDDKNRIRSRQKSVDQKVKGKKRTPTRNNYKKMIEKNRKLHNLLYLLNEERSKDTEDFEKRRHEIQETKQEIRSLSNELDDELNPPFKFNREIDENWYDARKTVQKDIQRKDSIKQIQGDLADRQTDQEGDSYTDYDSANESLDGDFEDANEEPQYRLLAKQLFEEGRRNHIVDPYREIKPVSKDERGIGLPHPRQYPRSVSRDRLEKHRNEEKRFYRQTYERYPGEFLEKISTIPLSPNDDVSADFQDTPLSPSESDEEPENFHDAPMFNFNQSKTIANDEDDDDDDFKDLDDFITPEKITEQNRTFGEFSHYKDQSDSKIPHRPTLSKRNQTQHRNNVNRLNLHPYR